MPEKSEMNAIAVAQVEESTNWLSNTVATARDLLANHDHFRGRAGAFEISESDGVLTVRGRVPSFYLKQLLHHALGSVSGIWKVENQVDVVSPDGLSSVRRR